MNIKELLDTESRITIAVTPLDLKEFALEIIEEQRRLFEEQEEAKRQKNTERMLRSKEVTEMLEVSSSTLWRWEQTGYLKPASRIGKNPVYRESDVLRIQRGGMV